LNTRRLSSILLAFVTGLVLFAYQNCAPVGTSSQFSSSATPAGNNPGDPLNNPGNTNEPPTPDPIDDTPAPEPDPDPDPVVVEPPPPPPPNICDDNNRPILVGISQGNGAPARNAVTIELVSGQGSRESGDRNPVASQRLRMHIDKNGDADHTQNKNHVSG